MSFSPQASFIKRMADFGLVEFMMKFKGLLVLPVLTRMIGAEGMGEISAVLTFCTMAQTLLLLSSNQSFQIYGANLESGEKRNRDFWHLFFFFGGLALSFALGLAAFHSPVSRLISKEPIDSTLMLIGAFMIPVQVLNLMLFSKVILDQESRAYSLTYTLSSLAETGLVIGGAVYVGTHAVMSAYVAGPLLLVLIVFFVIHRKAPLSLPNKQTPKTAIHYAKLGFPFLIIGLSAWVIDWSDRLIILKFLPTSELGIYQTSYNLCYQTAGLANIMFPVLMPTLTFAIAENNLQQAGYYCIKSVRFLLMLYLPVLMITIAHGDDLLLFLATEEFLPGQFIMPYVVVSVMLFQMQSVFIYVINAFHKPLYILVVQVIAGGMNVGLNLYFIPRYGIIAAALTTLISTLFSFPALWFISRRYISYSFPLLNILKIFLSIAVFFLSYQATNWLPRPELRLFAGSALGLLFFLAALWLSGAVYFEEKQRVALSLALRGVFPKFLTKKYHLDTESESP